MRFPDVRLRRLRRTPAIRKLFDARLFNREQKFVKLT